MEIIEKDFNGKKYYYICTYTSKLGDIYKFANKDESIYCKKEKNDFIPIKNKFLINRIKEKLECNEIKDIV